MEDTAIPTETLDEVMTEKKQVATGVPYPVESLADSLETINKLVAENGTSVTITKEDISKVTGKKQATLVLWFSTYQQYGLLSKVHGKGFITTPLYKKYIDKVYGHHEREAMLEMFKNPPLYNKIVENLNETNLPSSDRFPALLKNDPYNVNINSADRASKVFFENVKFLKIIDSNNKLIYKRTDGVSQSGQTKTLADPPKPPDPPNPKDELFELPIPLDSTRKAYIRYPLKDLKKKDIKVIVRALSFIASSIIEDGESDFEIVIREVKKEQ